MKMNAGVHFRVSLIKTHLDVNFCRFLKKPIHQ
jgi:hypothetical protein